MNRGGGALIRDRSPAAPFSDEIGWPPFLMREGPYTPPHSPGDSPERTPVGTLDFNPSPKHPSIHLNPPPLLKLKISSPFFYCGAGCNAKVLRP